MRLPGTNGAPAARENAWSANARSAYCASLVEGIKGSVTEAILPYHTKEWLPKSPPGTKHSARASSLLRIRSDRWLAIITDDNPSGESNSH